MNFNGIKKRLAELEPRPVNLGPWPPDEDSLGSILWNLVGKPVERMAFEQMLEVHAQQVWKSEVRE